MKLLICDYRDPLRYLEGCREYGIGMEFQGFCDPDHFFDRDLYRDYAASLPRTSIHAPYYDMSPGSSDPDISMSTQVTFNMVYKTALNIGASHIVFHNAFFPHSDHASTWLPEATAFWNTFFTKKDARVNCHIENIVEYEPDVIRDLIDSINLPYFTAALDVGHAHAFSKISVPQWIKKLGSRIGYVHLHSNYGKTDEHLALSEGSVPMLKTLELLREYAPHAVWALETRGDNAVMDSLNWLEKHKFL